MTFEGEDTQQDANYGESSAAPQTSTENTTEVTASETQESSSSQAQSRQETPFHEHPRFKELIEERNSMKGQLEQFQRQMEEMRSTREREEKQSHPFVQKLKEIDPKYGEWAESQEQLAAKLAEFEQWRDEQKSQSLRQQYESSIDKLHSENKVSPELRDRIRREIDYRAMTNPKLGMKDLPGVYKEVLEGETKFLDSVRRTERASYVKDKSRDSQAPATQTKGAPATTGGKRGGHGDREQAYSSIVKNALKGLRAESE